MEIAPAGIRQLEVLKKELVGFGGPGHDDMVFALALGVWGVRLKPEGFRANGAYC